MQINKPCQAILSAPLKSLFPRVRERSEVIPTPVAEPTDTSSISIGTHIVRAARAAVPNLATNTVSIKLNREYMIIPAMAGKDSLTISLPTRSSAKRLFLLIIMPSHL